MTPEQRVVIYTCPRCGHQWEQREEWDAEVSDWRFCDEPYGFCPKCSPASERV